MSASPTELKVQPCRARGASLRHFPEVRDDRGALSFGEVIQHLPFTPLRYFLVYDVPPDAIRGFHAHQEMHELLVCVRGACTVELDDGQTKEAIRLDSPRMGLHIPPRIWRIHREYTEGAVLMALASTLHDPADYIWDYDEFLRTLPQDT